ncbi:MAG: class I SAM-dependent methyltransferase [Burkholderiales bacterium]|nr:class I SAM-dependent methyltransferase [Burkholderiales bacterium]
MTQHRQCRFCGSPLSLSFADLGMSPLSNAYLKPGQLSKMEPFYPLHAWVCESCFLVQLEEFESPEHIFSDYAYFSSFSDSWLDHARRFTDQVAKRFALDASSFVVEIASNDGYLLQYFVSRGVPVLGIEPAANVAAEAERKGVPTLVKFFGTRTALDLKAAGKQVDLLIGNNVLAHVPGLNDFVAGMEILLKPGGVISMEFPHLLRLMEENQFDTIYHEHFSYFSFLVVERVFAKHGLTIFDMEEIPTHGGSLRIFAKRASNSALPVAERVSALRRREQAAGLDHADTYRAFAERVKATKRLLLRFLIDAREAGKHVVGYGAPAKGNTLLNYCGVRTDLLEYTVDRSPHKQGHFLPGTHIPVYAPEKIRETRPDYVLILPWNLKNEIVEQMAEVRSWGGKFVVPIPQVKVLD